MEFEIKDDPQGLADRPDGERAGGLREDHVELRKRRAEAADAKFRVDYEKRIFFSQLG